MGHGSHEQRATDNDSPPAHDAGSTEIERNDKTEANQQDDAPARTSSDNGDAAETADQTADGARTDDSASSDAGETTPTSASTGGDAPASGPAPASPPGDPRDGDKAAGTDGPKGTQDGAGSKPPATPGAGDDTAPLAPTAPSPPLTGALAGPAPTQPAPEIRPTTTAPSPESGRRGAYADDERLLTRPQPTSGEMPPAPPTAPVRPRHLRQPPVSKPAGIDDDERRRRRNLLLAISPVFIVLLIVVAWAVDTVTLSGQVLRNVTLAGDEIGGSGEDSLSEMVADMADQVASRPVVIEVEPATAGFAAGGQQGQSAPRRYETTAGDLGLTLDEEATVEAALDMGRGDTLFVRPFKWLASYMTSREAPLEFRMNEAQTVAALQMLQGTDQTAPVEPQIQLQNAEFVAVAGHPGTGLDANDVAESLLAAVEEADSLDQPVEIAGHQTDVAPRLSQEEAESVAARANEMTANGLVLKAADVSATVPPEQLRGWMSGVVVEEGDDFHLDLTFNNEAATQAAPGILSELATEPQNASVALQGGQPVVRPGRPGATCCGAEAGARMWEALNAGETEVTYEVEAQEPEHTTEEVEGWRIAAPIGGARAHQNGADVAGPGPGYTTYMECCQPRVTNIQRIAQETNGAIIPPGGTFSLNDHVGERTTADGYVAAGAIRDGAHVEEVGGGVSQFFTTMFNAAYFGGLDILEYQAHSENFSRYPDGREATGGWRNPDLVLRNDSPYGVLIQATTTGTSVTVTLWSTPHATAEQTGLSSSPSGHCTNVTSTRTRTYPDGHTERDSFQATYRPEGLFCDGTPVSTTTVPPG